MGSKKGEGGHYLPDNPSVVRPHKRADGASAKGIFHKKEAIYGIQQNWAHQ